MDISEYQEIPNILKKYFNMKEVRHILKFCKATRSMLEVSTRIKSGPWIIVHMAIQPRQNGNFFNTKKYLLFKKKYLNMKEARHILKFWMVTRSMIEVSTRKKSGPWIIVYMAIQPRQNGNFFNTKKCPLFKKIF